MPVTGSQWFDNSANANKLRNSYLKGFLDISGGGVSIRNATGNNGGSALNLFDDSTSVAKVRMDADKIRVAAPAANYTQWNNASYTVATVGSSQVDISMSAIGYLSGISRNIESSLVYIHSKIDASASAFGDVSASTVAVVSDATIGGMTSTGAAGTTTVRYGSMRENVLKLTAVLADGTVIHAGRETRKLSAGYDLTRLIVGSEGTLAIVTEITLRVFGIPEKMAAAVSRFPSLADGVQAAIAIVRSGVAIARCEFLDAQSIKNVNAHDGLTLQEAPTLLFEFHGSPRGVEEDAKVVQEITSEFGGTDFEWTAEEGQRRKLWQARHNAYWANIAAFPGRRAISTDAAVPLSKLADAVAIAEKILKESPFPHSILGHVADGNFHTFIVTDPTKPEELDAIRDLTHKTTSAIIAMGGTCTGEHGIGAGKIDSLLEEAGESSVAVMRSIKAALDPHGILNPGKIFL